MTPVPAPPPATAPPALPWAARGAPLKPLFARPAGGSVEWLRDFWPAAERLTIGDVHPNAPEPAASVSVAGSHFEVGVDPASDQDTLEASRVFAGTIWNLLILGVPEVTVTLDSELQRDIFGTLLAAWHLTRPVQALDAAGDGLAITVRREGGR